MRTSAILILFTGISEPKKSVSRRPLPSPRFISNILITDSDKPEKEKTLALAQWTQFIGNDLFHTAVTKMGKFKIHFKKMKAEIFAIRVSRCLTIFFFVIQFTQETQLNAVDTTGKISALDMSTQYVSKSVFHLMILITLLIEPSV